MENHGLATLEHKENLDRYQHEHIKQFFEYTQTQKSASTLRAYAVGWSRFTEWCNRFGYNYISVSPALKKSKEMLIGMFISDLTNQGVKLATIKCYLSGIKHYYGERKLDVSIDHPQIKQAIVGIRRLHGSKQDSKEPITPELLRSVIDDLTDLPIDNRDRALLLVGFAGAFRRSELVGIDIEHLSYQKDGVRIFIPKSKTDQSGEGRHVDIPHNDNEKYCAVVALKKWIDTAPIVRGPVFVAIGKGNSLSYKRLGGRSVALILKKRFKGLCDTENIAGHSLRSGHVTSAVRKGLHHSVIMKQTGHRSVDTLQRYIKLNSEFEANSAKNLV